MGVLRAVGLMSGTSLDGIDVALIETDGETISSFGPAATEPYSEQAGIVLRQALDAAQGVTDRSARPAALAGAEAMVTRLHESVVRTFFGANGIDSASVDVIGFHGHTVLHRPQQRLTVQIGDGAVLAHALRVPVVYDLRAADTAAGGEGAPLVPVFHRALTRRLERPQPVAVLNIGGVANVTWIEGDRDPVACDTGPGNALIDDFLLAHIGERQDTGGRIAASGRIDDTLLSALMDDPFFNRPPPKSLDRNDFRQRARQMIASRNLALEDVVTTLTAFTATAAAAVVAVLPRRPRTWVVAGGGAHNATLIKMLTHKLTPASVETAATAGWSIDALEAQAFAFLAVRAVKGYPITFPTTTGVRRPLCGGVLARP